MRSFGQLALGLTLVLPIFSQRTVNINNIPAGPQGSFVNTVATNACTGQGSLACALPNLYGPYGLVLPNEAHAAHFNSEFQSNFTALNQAIATQLTLLPLASPAPGFTYKYDPNTGAYTRSASTFGPILTERAETAGRHRFFFAATFQRFRFDKLDGQSLHNLPAVFSHQKSSPSGPPLARETQFVSTSNNLDLKVNQFTFFATFGLTDRIDVSLAVPLLQVGFKATSQAQIIRTENTEPTISGNGPPFNHFFDPTDQQNSLTHTFVNDQTTMPGDLYWNSSNSGAAGIGDIVFRFKGNVYKSDRLNLALLADLRAPTGNERNFLGSGAWGLKPFVAMSIHTKWATPHVNLGYQWNGSSLLAGDIAGVSTLPPNAPSATKGKLPGFALFSVGSDFGLTDRLTFAADYIGQQLINAPRLAMVPYVPSTDPRPLIDLPSGQLFTVGTIKETYNQSNAAFGLKYNLFKRFLLSGNLLIALNDGGLRQRVVPLFGISYAH